MEAIARKRTPEEYEQAHDQALSALNDYVSCVNDALGALARVDKILASVGAPSMVGWTPTDEDRNSRARWQVEKMKAVLEIEPPPEFTASCQQLIRMRIWKAVFDQMGVIDVMDAEAKKEFEATLEFQQVPVGPKVEDQFVSLVDLDAPVVGPPMVTADNVRGTAEQFMQDADEMFVRGIARVFSALDPRFRSHDLFGFKDRVVLTGVFDQWGDWCYHSRTKDKLIDILRVFRILDGKRPKPHYVNETIQISEERRQIEAWGARQSQHETEYFRVRCFKNGNMHLWFTRKDLVEKINELLKDYYDLGVTDGKTEQEVAEERAQQDMFSDAVSRPHAKNLGWFPTPEALTDHLFHYHHVGPKGLRILEPSVGEGALLRGLFQQEGVGSGDTPTSITTYEIDPQRYEISRRYLDSISMLFPSCQMNPCGGDFLQSPTDDHEYDLILMNPPFDHGRDAEHVAHAAKMLSSVRGNRLLAIVSAGFAYAQTGRRAKIRKWLEQEFKDVRFMNNPEGSFKECGTNVNTCTLSLHRAWY